MITPTRQELNAPSRDAQAAILDKDEARLKKAIASARRKIAGVIPWSTRLAPHLLSTAISVAWIRGAELLMPIDNQWQPQLVNWRTRRPAALDEDKQWGFEDMAFWQDVACTPLGFACISGHARCVKIIMNSQTGRRLWPADLSQNQGLGTLDFLIRQGGVRELKTYLAAGGNAGQEDAQGTVLGLWAIERLLAESRPSGTQDAQPSVARMAEADKRAAAMLRLLAEHGLSAAGRGGSIRAEDAGNRPGSLWNHCLQQSAPEMARELLRQGMSPNLVTKTELGMQRPLSLAASQENPLLHDLSAKTIAVLLGAGAQADYLEEAPSPAKGLAPALMFAVYAKNWAAAKALAGSTTMTSDIQELLKSQKPEMGKVLDIPAIMESPGSDSCVGIRGNIEDGKRGENRQASEEKTWPATERTARGPGAQELEDRVLAAEGRANDLERELACMRKLVKLMEERMSAAGVGINPDENAMGLLNHQARASMEKAIGAQIESPRSVSRRKA